MDVEERKDEQPVDVAGQAIWECSENRFQTPEELDAQFTAPDDDGGGYRRHGIGPATVVMALAQAGFRGPINAQCLQELVELAIERGVREMVVEVYQDAGLTFIPRNKWWFCKGLLLSAEDAEMAEVSRCVRHGHLPAAPLRRALERRSGNLRQLAKELELRFGTKAASEYRQLERLCSCSSATVREEVAERYAAALGRHLVELYPNWR